VSQSEESKIRRPPKDLRDQLRRDQIVDAARQCVVRHGFHAASMAEIAAAARMSVGQIYRYFPNKDAIVHAIVERIVVKRLQGMIETRGSADLPTLLAERLIGGGTEEPREDQILMLEVTAEATRNPTVAQIVRQADQRLMDEAVATILRDQPELDEREVAGRVELMAVLFDGTMLRRLSGRPIAVIPLSLCRSVIEHVLPGPRKLPGC
jgi:AcrR family transcriptional regulator